MGLCKLFLDKTSRNEISAVIKERKYMVIVDYENK